MCLHVRQLLAGIKDGQSSCHWQSFDLVCSEYSPVLTGITQLFPIDRTNGYDRSFQSLANNPYGSSPIPFSSIVHCFWLLGLFPDRGILSKVDTSREFVCTF